VRLVLGQNSDKLLEAGNTSTREELQQFISAITRLYSVNDVLSLRPRDTADRGTSKLADEGRVRVDEIQQMDTVYCQFPHVSCV